MRIEEDTKLDFKDVLIRPKRSTLGSRKDVDITREFKFKWSGKSFKGVPIIAANMDGVGTFDMARAFVEDGNGLTAALGVDSLDVASAEVRFDAALQFADSVDGNFHALDLGVLSSPSPGSGVGGAPCTVTFLEATLRTLGSDGRVCR